MADHLGFDFAGRAQSALDAMVAKLADDEELQRLDICPPVDRYITGADNLAFMKPCLILHVNLAQVAPLGSPVQYSDGVTFAATFGFTWVWEAAADADPDSDALVALGGPILAIGGALMRAAIAAYFDNSLTGDHCDPLYLGPLNWQGPSGDLVGVTLTWQAPIL